MTSLRPWILSFGAVLALAAGAPALAQHSPPQGGEVNITGATLFQDFYRFPASTNDFIDADCDGIYGPLPNLDQLAPDWTCPNWNPPMLPPPANNNGWWLVQYRGVGSVNGLKELVDYALCGSLPATPPTGVGYINRSTWFDSTPPGILGVPGCSIAAPPNTGTPYAPTSQDIATLDVPAGFGVRVEPPGDARWYRNPLEQGYGYCPKVSDLNESNLLQSLSRACTSRALNLNTLSPDADTLFDTQVAWVPIGILANRGVARPDENADGIAGDIKFSDLQYAFTTGRLRTGENLAIATRDAGSGTRNGCMNSLGIDPSWGVGDNTGSLAAAILEPQVFLGSTHHVTYCEGSGIMERAVEVRRLAIGYTGLAGSSRAQGDVAAGRYEVLNVRKDVAGATGYVRPTNRNQIIQNLNPNTGWQIGGSETFVTLGDPLATADACPGQGVDWIATSNPAMTNSAASLYIRNIYESVRAFVNAPANSQNFGSPGEYLATQFFLNAGIDALPVYSDPIVFEDQTSKPTYSLTLRTWMLSNNTYSIPAYGAAPNAGPGGQTPTRTALTAGTYADGSTQNYKYRATVGGPLLDLTPRSRLSYRNRTQGDFNNDGLRNMNDAARMMAAIQDPLNFIAIDGIGAGPNGDMAADVAVPHVIGDFDGNGDFDSADIRYFGDGLGMDPAHGGLLNRTATFAAIDNAWAGLPGGDNNYFNTTLPFNSCRGWVPGFSAADIAGNAPTPGAQPSGSDGHIDARDIDYVYRNFVDWTSDLDTAVTKDLSAELTGPESDGAGGWKLVIDHADVDYLVHTVICTEYGDVNLDGHVDQADADIVAASISTPPAPSAIGWATGDLNGDGTIDAADAALVAANMGFISPCLNPVGDSNCDGVVDNSDIDCFVAALLGHPCENPGCPLSSLCLNDANGDGVVDNSDIDCFVGLLLGTGCP